jgi:hypothetical protein
MIMAMDMVFPSDIQFPPLSQIRTFLPSLLISLATVAPPGPEPTTITSNSSLFKIIPPLKQKI